MRIRKFLLAIVTLPAAALLLSSVPQQKQDWCCLMFTYEMNPHCNWQCQSDTEPCPTGNRVEKIRIVDATCSYKETNLCALDQTNVWLQFFGTCEPQECNPPEAGKHACVFHWDDMPGTPVNVTVCMDGVGDLCTSDPL